MLNFVAGIMVYGIVALGYGIVAAVILMIIHGSMTFPNVPNDCVVHMILNCDQ
jgi:hypothetical protein